MGLGGGSPPSLAGRCRSCFEIVMIVIWLSPSCTGFGSRGRVFGVVGQPVSRQTKSAVAKCRFFMKPQTARVDVRSSSSNNAPSFERNQAVMGIMRGDRKFFNVLSILHILNAKISKNQSPILMPSFTIGPMPGFSILMLRLGNFGGNIFDPGAHVPGAQTRPLSSSRLNPRVERHRMLIIEVRQTSSPCELCRRSTFR